MTLVQEYDESQHGIPASPYSLLVLYADSLYDIEKIRIATANRIQALKEQKGIEDSPEVRQWEDYLERLKEMEKHSIKQLEGVMRIHPLGLFVKNTIGLGEKQTARLLATIGDPADRPNIAKLWAYCGFHTVPEDITDPDSKMIAPKLRRGVQPNWNVVARSRARLCAESCIKQMHSPYRVIYDKTREKYKDEKITDLHKHNRALRMVAKEILKDLWREAKKANGTYEPLEENQSQSQYAHSN